MDKINIEVKMLLNGEKGILSIVDKEEEVLTNKLKITGEGFISLMKKDRSEYNPYDGFYFGKANNFVRCWIRIFNSENRGELEIVKVEGDWKNPKNWTPPFENEEGVIY